MTIDEEDKEDIMELLHTINAHCRATDSEKFGLPLDNMMDRETLIVIVQTWLEENFLDA